jgi:hypothetical protein
MNTCPNDNSKLIAQTLFLGASVSSFNCNLGWSGQPSQVTVTLVDDLSEACGFAQQFATPVNSYLDNHYYDCSGDDCYVDIDGSSWNSNQIGQPRQNGSTIYQDDKKIPGKIYYGFSSSNSKLDPIVSRYWLYPDPGFLGTPNRINTDGTVNLSPIATNVGYDIIGVPVYFKMGNFSFGGVIQSWEENLSNGGKQYRVIIDGFQSVLSNCFVIVGEYGGAIFSKYNSSSNYGMPRNYVGNLTTYDGSISEGNIPNVFNVYGFLESTAPENFGGSNTNEDGMSAKEILGALRILTSSASGGAFGNANNLKDRAVTTNNDFAPKTSYSPFGRILVKKPQQYYTHNPITTNFTEWGVIPATTNIENGGEFCEFLLDLSEIVNPPDDFRIKGPVINVLQLINEITEATGYDYTVELIPVNDTSANKTYNVIKIKTISRLAQPIPNQIKNTTKQLLANGYNVSSNTIGKEKNESPARCVIIGGKQQRLYQAKSYRLGYTQSNFIFDTYNRRFVDYTGLGHIKATISLDQNGGSTTNSLSRISSLGKNFGYGKIKFPSFYSTRNIALNNIINPNTTALTANEEDLKTAIAGIGFNTADSVWTDHEITNIPDIQNKKSGNYDAAKKGDYPNVGDWGIKSTKSSVNGLTINKTNYGGANGVPAERYFPLYKDVICPFFGYLMDNEYDIDTTKSTNSNDFRRIRPVYFDTWTGQICVLFRASELPATRIELEGLYGGFSGLSRNAMPFAWSSVRPGATTNPSAPATGTTATATNTTTSSSSSTGPSLPKKEYFFMVTESEFRAAMEGEENFIAYSLAKTYKTDLYLMLNQAYINKQYIDNLAAGQNAAEAYRMAVAECDWHWSQNETIIVNATFTPEPVVGDKNNGLQKIEEEPRKDFDTIAKFLRSIGEKFYGRKYMVQAPFVGARRDMSFADIAIPTEAGYAYVFRGNNKLKFNYEPTNEGAWEEYGNIIDDSVAVGSKEWHSLSDERGLISPIVGYNVTDNFDRVRYNTCLAAISDANFNKQTNPFFHYSAWAERKATQNGTCDPIDFIFPSIDLGTIPDTTRYVAVQCQKTKADFDFNTIARNFPLANSIFDSGSITQIDAFGLNGFSRKKLYHTTSVDENIVFIDPEQLTGPRIIIDAPGISLNNSSESFQKDPNKTIIANIAIEDVAIYLRTNHPSSWDISFLNLMSSYIENVNPEGLLIGDYSKLSQNTTANNITMKQKMAHPFFVGIPIKSNQFTYGPWTNYPHLDVDRDNIFPNGQNIEFDIATLTSTTGDIIYTTQDKKRAIDNWIAPTKVEFNPDFVPWNYGGMAYLDAVADIEVKSQINYQNILETANIEMPGLPLFNLGGAFNDQALNNQLPIQGLYYNEFSFSEVKRVADPLAATQNIPGLNELNNINNLVYGKGTLTYKTVNLPYRANYLSGPIISTIGVDVGQNGIKTTYMFRTYSRKLSLFNKEYADKIKKFTKDNFARDKQAAKINQQISNRINNDKATMVDERDRAGDLQSASSKLLGWSPVEVIVATASPFLKEPFRSPQRIEQSNSSTMPTGQTTSQPPAVYSLSTDDDIGTASSIDNGFNETNTQIPTLYNKARVRTTAQIYQISELNDFVKQDYGSKAVMSLDGIFSPVSFYPTNNVSTFSFSKYQTSNCPVCKGTQIRTIDWKKFSAGSITTTATGTYDMVCNACCNSRDKLNSSLDFSTLTNSSDGTLIPPFIITSGSDLSLAQYFTRRADTVKGTPGQNIPINLVSLQPLIMPYSEFKNPNVQNYTGVHPDEKHAALTIGGKNRNFIDRSRHSISIVGRSAVPQQSLQIYSNLDDSKYKLPYPTGTDNLHNSDYFYKDIKAIQNLKALGNQDVDYELNQRFIGLRGPLVIHGWGYDKEGFPVPNAADEPLELDEFARPLRFMLIRSVEDVTTYIKLAVGSVFVLSSADGPDKELIKSPNLKIQNTLGNNGGSDISNDTSVYPVRYGDATSQQGGFLNKGSIISKTQKFVNGKWTPKQKLKEFYLNWGERPDLWPVGPIDLRWDAARKVWTSSSPIPFKMMYVTLEEDLVQLSGSESYVARGFLDDTEFSTEPMPNGTRRVVFVKDRCGYTAPRGAKLLCRYDTDSGFYEPVSKPSFIAKGTMTTGSNQANIEMSYAQGQQSGETYTSMLVNFENPFGLSTSQGVGLFTYINGKWTLTTSK